MAKHRPGKREREAFKLRLEQANQARANHDPYWRAKSCLNVTQTTDWASDWRPHHEQAKRQMFAKPRPTKTVDETINVVLSRKPLIVLDR